MKARAGTLSLLGLAVLTGCKEQPQPRGETAAPARKPVVAVAPVPTKPFEEGYDAGFEQGKKDARPRAKIPDPEDAERVAREQSAGHPERIERWQRGFVEGYIDGFRNVVTGKK